MQANRPFVMIFAGLDPSAGAGLLADIKTCEANKTYGLGITTALTVQDDERCSRVDWIDIREIKAQAEPLLKKFKPQVIKTGIVADKNMLTEILNLHRHYVPNGKSVVDPVLSATGGSAFTPADTFANVLGQQDVLTPNWNEMVKLGESNDALNAAENMSALHPVFLKGGHAVNDMGRDYLFTGQKKYSFRPAAMKVYDKHGSGCVLASAIAANLAHGFGLHKSCLRARQYTQRFMSSDKSLLGFHL